MFGRTNFDPLGQSVIIAGGSKGLGRELALQLADRGANVAILGRTPKALEETLQDLQQKIKGPDQKHSSTVLDLTDAAQVTNYIDSLPEPPSILFCVAGGTASEIGFFADIAAEDIRSCMERNYFAAAFIAHAVLKQWLARPPPFKQRRHIVFTASTAAFVGLPGYTAYTPTKTATRALADTLRQEVLLYRSQQDIRVHCSFPGTIYTDAFYEEQTRKPDLLKELEGSNKENSGLTAARAAELTIEGLKQGRFFITMDMETELLLNNMRGPSPRYWSVWDWILGLLASLVWPVFRIMHDRKTSQYRREQRKNE
ncbi:steroid dehydrogenase, putative [Talaromyces stipitatus ATCC 10500]|uniref:3-dehydrosphinganine reductase n=1 Tax=Talaromyces stipitatus (strain ATCC 10500 / CBS 375.48 / QM 6759 / NRRL 1006) TaxID=441959 RepID=B8MJB4_TALSN|nr:steroid dehydrogenase, putative [Talaromyces stipitatus ATCC 10500]EED14703.1 steroid dehydrogenase, putative [Talaromyces stipitatus ATCC 10500]